MSRQVLLAIILVLAFLGLADSWYLASSAATDTLLTCGIESLDECNTVAQSEYSKLFGVPLAYFGVVFYGLIFVCAAVLIAVSRPWLTKLLFGLCVLGLLASLYFLYLQVALIKALCIYCLLSFVIAAFLFAVSWAFKKVDLAVVHPVVP